MSAILALSLVSSRKECQGSMSLDCQLRSTSRPSSFENATSTAKAGTELRQGKTRVAVTPLFVMIGELPRDHTALCQRSGGERPHSWMTLSTLSRLDGARAPICWGVGTPLATSMCVLGIAVNTFHMSANRHGTTPEGAGSGCCEVGSGCSRPRRPQSS